LILLPVVELFRIACVALLYGLSIKNYTYLRYMAKIKDKGGRPLKFKNVKELEDKIAEYFRITPDKEQIITGLAVYLDTSRETLINYQNRERFYYAINRAKDRIQASYERSLRNRGNSGDIFALKNFGWTDKQETDLNVKGNLDLGKAFKDAE